MYSPNKNNFHLQIIHKKIKEMHISDMSVDYVKENQVLGGCVSGKQILEFALTFDLQVQSGSRDDV